MDKKAYDETVKRLKAASKVISGLDAEMRTDGWAILKPYITGAEGGGGAGVDSGGSGSGASNTNTGPAGSALNLVELLEEHASDDDANKNGLLIAAILYGTYGHGPYKPKEFKAVGDEHHLLLPRWSNFFPRTNVDEKKAFRNTKDGWVLTAHGGKWITATYGVKRGTQPKPG